MAEVKAKATRVRSASPFTPTTKVTVSIHADADAIASTDTLAAMFTAEYGSDFAVRTVSRHRATKSGKAPSGPASLMVYIAPSGYEFAAVKERGVRLDSETANLLRQVAASMGLDPNDSASILAVAKALATKATAK